MNAAHRLLLSACCAAALAAPLSAQQRTPATDPKQTAIRQLLELTGAASIALRGMETMVPAQRAANPAIPGVFWDAFVAHARRNVNQLVDSLVPIYAAHFDQGEIDGLVRFYSSPLGRKVAQVQPAITQESMQAGQRWGAALGQQIAESLMQAGVRIGGPN